MYPIRYYHLQEEQPAPNVHTSYEPWNENIIKSNIVFLRGLLVESNDIQTVDFIRPYKENIGHSLAWKRSVVIYRHWISFTRRHLNVPQEFALIFQSCIVLFPGANYFMQYFSLVFLSEWEGRVAEVGLPSTQNHTIVEIINLSSPFSPIY